jgi:Putative peptidoglycan binding domain/Lysozyme like domain
MTTRHAASGGRHRRPTRPASYGRGAMVAAAGMIGTTAGVALTAEPAGALPLPDVGIATAARAAGLPSCRGVPLGTWVAIALAESSGNTTAHNSRGEDSRGLWQINLRSHPGLANGDLYDPTTNAEAARAICESAGPGAWTVYTTGAYQRYLARGDAAAAAAGGALVVVPVTQPAPASRTTTRPALSTNLSTALVHQVRSDVAQAQNRLRQLGYSIAADGRYGPKTRAAVRDYQGRHGLAADGVVGPRTWASLLG